MTTRVYFPTLLPYGETGLSGARHRITLPPLVAAAPVVGISMIGVRTKDGRGVGIFLDGKALHRPGAAFIDSEPFCVDPMIVFRPTDPLEIEATSTWSVMFTFAIGKLEERTGGDPDAVDPAQRAEVDAL